MNTLIYLRQLITRGQNFIQFDLESKSDMSNLQTFKFVFTAQIGEFNIKANISSPIYVTWKRSQQSAVSQTVDLVTGKADFKNQVLKLPVNMYFDKDASCFQEKKSSFSFTMKAPKGQKTAGIVYVDLSKMLNNKLTQLSEDFPLQKCPVKDSSVKIRLTSECLGEKTDDTQSKTSVNAFGGSQSTISINSTVSQHKPERSTEKAGATSTDNESKDKQVQQLKQKLLLLTKQNQSLKKQLQSAKQSVKGDNLKQQLLKSKVLQDRLQQQVNSLRRQNQQHEKELQSVRSKLQEAYTNLYSNLSKHFL